MRFKNPSFQRLLLFISISLLTFQASFATHLRAGEITARRVSATSLTYRVTLTTYTDQIMVCRQMKPKTMLPFILDYLLIKIFRMK